MVKILPSTFKILDQNLSVIDNRRNSVAVIRHISIPFTIVADMVVGVAHLVFLGLNQELTKGRFWDISHEHFFVYPFQQLIYFLFSSYGALQGQGYYEGYRLGQWGVMNISNEVYHGPPQIFAHLIASYAHPQYFPNITLSDHDRRNLHQLVSHVTRFQHYKSKMEQDNSIKQATHIYQVFYDEKPLSLHKLDELYLQKVDGASCDERDAYAEAKGALEAFFALPRLVQVRLTQPH